MLPTPARPIGPCVAALAILVVSCGPADAPPPPPTRVTVAAAQPGDHAAVITLTGDVAARVSSELSFRIGGRIQSRKAEVGDRVQQGQELATLDREQQDASVTSAEADVQAAEAQLRQAASTFERQKALVGQGFTTRREYDQAEAALRGGTAALEGARAKLTGARDQLEQTTLRATAAGVLTSRRAEAGEVVQAAQAVFTLAQDGPRDAVFNVYESIFAHEPSDRAIKVALIGDPASERRATLREVSPVLDTATGTVRVKFEIQDPPPAMTLGVPVVGSGTFTPRRGSLLPWSALASDAGHPAVWSVDPAGNTVSLRRVEVDGFEVGTVLVRSGIDPGQLVVTRGQQLLRPGQVVEPVKDGAP